VAAVAVAPLSAAAQRRALQCGPLLLALGLAALAVTLPAQPLIWVVAAMLLIGTGFGTSYAFLNQRVMAAAQAGQEDATAGAAPTLGALGGAVGAALAGLAGNGLGLDQVLTATSVTQASRVLAGAGALLALVAALLVRRLLQRAG